MQKASKHIKLQFWKELKEYLEKRKSFITIKEYHLNEKENYPNELGWVKYTISPNPLPADLESWNEFHDWLRVNLEKLYEVFEPRIQQLDTLK